MGLTFEKRRRMEPVPVPFRPSGTDDDDAQSSAFKGFNFGRSPGEDSENTSVTPEARDAEKRRRRQRLDEDFAEQKEQEEDASPEEEEVLSDSEKQPPPLEKAKPKKIKIEKEKEEEKKVVPVAVFKQPVTPIQGRNPVVVSLEKNVEEIVRNGLTYLDMFVGSLGAAFGDRDVRQFYKWRDRDGMPGKNSNLQELTNPVKRGARTIEEFIIFNKHLGSKLLSVIIPSILEEKSVANDDRYKDVSDFMATMQQEARIGEGLFGDRGLFSNVPVTVDDELYIQSLIQKHIPDTGNFPNAQTDWVFSVLDDATFIYLLEATSLGAMNMALSQIREIPNCRDFTLRQLMMSDGVRDKFALFVVFHYQLMSGGNAYSGRKNTSRGRLNGTTYMVSQGFQTRNALYAQVETGKYWFQRVYPQANRRYKEMQDFKRKLEEALGQDYGNPNQIETNETRAFLVTKSQEEGGLDDLVLLLAYEYATITIPVLTLQDSVRERIETAYKKSRLELTQKYNKAIYQARRKYAVTIGEWPNIVVTRDAAKDYIDLTREIHGIDEDIQQIGDAYFEDLEESRKTALGTTMRTAQNALARASERERTQTIEKEESTFRAKISSLIEKFNVQLGRWENAREKALEDNRELVARQFEDDELRLMRQYVFKQLTGAKSLTQLQQMYSSGSFAKNDELNFDIKLTDDEKERLKAMIYLKIVEKQLLGMPKTVLVHYE